MNGRRSRSAPAAPTCGIDLFALAWVPRWEVKVGDQVGYHAGF